MSVTLKWSSEYIRKYLRKLISSNLFNPLDLDSLFVVVKTKPLDFLVLCEIVYWPDKEKQPSGSWSNDVLPFMNVLKVSWQSSKVTNLLKVQNAD